MSRDTTGLRYERREYDSGLPYWAWVNVNGVTWTEWETVARLGEEEKIRPIVEERKAAFDAAVTLGGTDAGRAVRCCWLGPYWQPDRGLRMTPAVARKAWRAGVDPTEYRLAPRPLPMSMRRFT